MANQANKKSSGTGASGMEKTKKKVVQVFNQAKESLKILETLERETLAKAKSFVKIPNSAERKRMTNDRILSSLKKLGVATQAEVEALELKVKKLEAALSSRKEQRASHTSDSH